MNIAANLRSSGVSSQTGGNVPARAPVDVPGDQELVRLVRHGHTDAFDRLIERHQQRAVSVAYRLLGNLHDALEVCQDAFVKAWQNIDTLEDEQRFGSWLLRIVTNLSLNFRRDRAVGGRKRSFDDCLLSSPEGPELHLGDPDHSEDRPGARLAAEELHALLRKALDELPQAQRTALVLFSMEQMPQKDVAAIMGCSVEAVKWHVFQARRKLKERLADYL